ncbi:uncharacterized protein [Watersipora subatra]|uniref:uncharacterized protein n=1 Tax=Watersipora subatra TaxID=2589382 RepID=UPI00355BD6FF
MNHLLDYKGGTYIPEYLATDTISARNHFPDASKMRFRWTSLENIDKLGKKWRQLANYAADDQSDMKTMHKMVGRRRRRQLRSLIMQDDGNERFDVSCSDAGEASVFDPNYLHLCAICSSKRSLPPDRYPSVLNEVFCKPSNGGCLGNGQGKCVETIFNVRILKRRDDICRLCVKDTEALAVNEWETYVEQVSVGCECLLHKNSAYQSLWFSKGSSNGGIG